MGKPLHVSDRRWPDKKSGPYVVRLHFDEDEGRPVCVGVEVWGRTPPPSLRPGGGSDRHPQDTVTLPGVTPVTTTALRLPLGRMIAELTRRQLQSADLIRRHRQQMPKRMVQGAKRARATWEARQGIGRPPLYDDDWWKGVARVYSEAWRAGAPPLQAVMEAFHVNKSTAAKWVAKARDEGHLAPTSRGVAGGVPKSQRSRRKK